MRRWLVPHGPLLAIVGAAAWIGTEKQWLGDAGFAVQWDRFIPEGTGGHTLLLATKAA
jgi:hypothetical protein